VPGIRAKATQRRIMSRDTFPNAGQAAMLRRLHDELMKWVRLRPPVLTPPLPQRPTLVSAERVNATGPIAAEPISDNAVAVVTLKPPPSISLGE